MTKSELARETAAFLRKRGLRKKVTLPKYTLHISDDEGNSKDFVIKHDEKEIPFSIADVERVLDGYIAVIEDSIRRGEPVTIRGFGTFGLKYRPKRTIKKFNSSDPQFVDARYVPKFTFGNDLRMCARIYGMSLEDKVEEIDAPLIIDDEFDLVEVDGEDDGY